MDFFFSFLHVFLSILLNFCRQVLYFLFYLLSCIFYKCFLSGYPKAYRTRYSCNNLFQVIKTLITYKISTLYLSSIHFLIHLYTFCSRCHKLHLFNIVYLLTSFIFIFIFCLLISIQKFKSDFCTTLTVLDHSVFVCIFTFDSKVYTFIYYFYIFLCCCLTFFSFQQNGLL